MDTPPPNCWDCRHFRVIWERRCPYACTIWGSRAHASPATRYSLRMAILAARLRPKRPENMSPARSHISVGSGD